MGMVALAEKHGLNIAKGGTRTGHMLQIFMKRNLIHKYTYAALPYGHLDAARADIRKHMDGSGKISGQVRIVVHPSAFLYKNKVRTFTFSANKSFHKEREEFQEELVKELS